MVSFNLRHEESYWAKGFFNVPVDFESLRLGALQSEQRRHGSSRHDGHIGPDGA